MSKRSDKSQGVWFEPGPAPAGTGAGKKAHESGASRPRYVADSPADRGLAWLIFALLLFAYAYFCPGGGWNQNARFDQVRSIVEGRTFAINEYMSFGLGSPERGQAERRLARVPVPEQTPTNELWKLANSGDVTRHGDRIYPGKPPGTVLLAVPAYALVFLVERQLGIDLDAWWPMTVNAYLTRVFSVGVISALGGVVFFRLSRRLFPTVSVRAHVLSTLAFGLATMTWPFATLFFDHNIVATLLLGAFGLIVRVRDGASARAGWLIAAGALLGLAAVCNYLAVIPILILSAYALATVRPARRVIWMWAGGVLPAVFLAWYHHTCFGSIGATANTEEPGMFQDSKLVLGMFGKPDPKLLFDLLLSSYRGLFFFSPILVLAVLALAVAVVLRQRRAEMLTCLAVFVAYWAMNASFQGWSKAWTGGWSFGPRYLIPGAALLALPLCAAFDRLPKFTMLIAFGSFLVVLLGTAVDPQPPVDIRKPIPDYLWPLACGDPVENAGRPIRGVVSANPIGVYEGFYFRVFQAGSPEVRWNSFNLGEFLWPHRRLSLLPLLAVLGGGVWLLWRWTRVHHRGTETQRKN